MTSFVVIDGAIIQEKCPYLIFPVDRTNRSFNDNTKGAHDVIIWH